MNNTQTRYEGDKFPFPPKLEEVLGVLKSEDKILSASLLKEWLDANCRDSDLVKSMMPHIEKGDACLKNACGYAKIGSHPTEHAEAARHYYDALKANPLNVVALKYIGHCLLGCGRHEEALVYLQAAKLLYILTVSLDEPSLHSINRSKNCRSLFSFKTVRLYGIVSAVSKLL